MKMVMFEFVVVGVMITLAVCMVRISFFTDLCLT